MSIPAGQSHSSTPGRRSRRRGWRSFLTPGWVLTTIVALAFAYTAFTVLAPWQLGKNTDTQKFNHRLEAALEHDPVAASTVLTPEGVSAGEEKEWTRVELQGTFLPDAEVLLRNRPVSSQPAFQVLTPFRTDDGLTVLVNRGWIAPVDGAGVPDIESAPATKTTVSGYVRMSEAVPDTAPIVDQGRQQVYGMNTAQIAGVTDLPLAGDYVQLDSDSVAGRAGQGLTAIPLPKLDSGPYLSYGIQWIAFGIMVPLGLGYFVWAELRERRRTREEIAAAEAQGVAGKARVSAQSGGTPTGKGVAESRRRWGDQSSHTPHGGHSSLEPGVSPGVTGGSAAASGSSHSEKLGRTSDEVPAASAAQMSRERKLAERYGQARQRAFEDRNARDEDRF